MEIVRKIHDQFRVKTVAGAKLETPKTVSSQEAGGSTFITITGGGGGTSLSGSGLSEQDRIKLDSIEYGAQVNQDAFSKLQFDISSIDENDQISNSNSTIIANVPTDTANIKIVGNYPITVNLESVSLFNSNTSTTTGTTITTYNISFNDSNNIVIEYVDGTLLKVTDVELIQVKHKENILATYQLSDITYTTSDGTITSFTIPYSNTDFSEIEFCKYETVTTETEQGSTTVRELRVLSILPASPTKQAIITLNNVAGNFWNYEEDENGNKFVWTDYNVYSTKDVSAYGRGTDLGNIYASNLYELKDVVLTDLSDNDLLIYNSSIDKWVNVNKDQLGGFGRTTLSSLEDVGLSSLATNDMLTYDGTKWVNIPMSQIVTDAYTKSEMDNKLATITNIVEDVQRQTNRQVTFWFFEYNPTTTNYPASEWTTDEEKLKHEEDMFYNSTSGKVWRWKLNDSSQYEWSLITDADTLRALELVEIAQNTANQKKRNFTTTPTSDDAYDVGDLWSNATYGTSYDNDLLVCTTAKTAGIDFSISHWQPVGKVTSSYVSSQIYTINNSINTLDTRVQTAESTLTTITSEAPSDLNTFKKLSAAINNDANYYNTVNNKIASEVSALNSRIGSEVNTLNSRIDTEVKTLQDQLDTIFSWFGFENSCIKAKYSLFSVGEVTAYKTS